MTTWTTSSRTGRPVWSVSRTTTRLLSAVACVLTFVGIFAVWANRLVLNPDNWAKTSVRLLDNRPIRAAVAGYLVDEIYRSANVSGALQGQLPPALGPLALPLTGALRAATVRGTELALQRPAVRRAWESANRSADATLVAIVDGGGRGVSVTPQTVTLNLHTLLDEVAGQLGITADIGALLPASTARLVVLRSDQVGLVQTLGRGLRGLALLMYVLVPCLYLLILLIAHDRRRALGTIGWAGLLAGLAALLARALMVSAIPNALVSDAGTRPAAGAAVSIATATVVDLAGAVILIGAVMIVGAWVAGPAWPATRLRRALWPVLGRRPWLLFTAVAVLLAALFVWGPLPATREPLGIAVLTGLAVVGVEALRRQCRREARRRSPVPGEPTSP